MRSIKVFLLPLCVASAAFSFAQPVNNAVKSVVMATPNAAALGKYGDIPVNLHTGVPNIGIPLATVQEGPLSLDISLSYHPSGIKIAEPASWVGLGWSLNAGGVISRTVQGLKDEGPNGYYASTTPVPWPMNATQAAQYGNTHDGEPDIFSFNLGGYAGKFFINKDKKIYLAPKQDLNVSVNYSNNQFNSFLIKTSDGTKYYFGSAPGDGTTNTAREQSTVDDPTALATTSWYLRRIESQDGFYSITLNYTDEDYSFKTPASCEYKYVFCVPGGSSTQTWNCSNNSVDPQHYYNRVLVKGKRLNTINTSLATLTFIPTTAGREDLEAYPPLTTPLPKALDKIKIEQTTTYCTEFRFTYDYVTDPSHNTIPEGKRLRLKDLLEISCDGTVGKEPYKFTYQGNTMTWRLSHMVDHWGFNNGAASNESKTINAPPTTVISGGTTFNYGLSDRNSNESSMLEGVLTKMDYPTGGNTQFTYEANDYPTTETYPYNDYLVQVSNCTYPQACCGTQSGETTRSFTSTELSGARYKFTLINPTCYNGGQPACNPQYPIQAQLEIFQMPGNIPISTSTVLNIYGSVCEDTIGGLLINLVNLQPNISYRFKVTGINGKGTFQIFKYAQGTNYVNKKVGGLRIKQIKSHDGANTANDIIRTYEYRSDANPAASTGVLFYTPVYGFGLTSGGVQMANFRDGAISPMSGFENYHIGYSLVTELFNGNGKTKHTFVIEPMSGYGNTFPVIPEPTRLQNGFESASTMLNQAGAVVASSSVALFNDSYVLPNGGTNNKVKVFRIATACAGYDPIYIFSNPYPMRTRHVRAGTTTSTIDGVSITQTFNYESTKTYAPPIDFSVTNSDGKVTKTEYKYAWNLTGFVADSLKKRNMIGMPLETIVKVSNVQVDGNKVDFALYDKTTGSRLTGGSTNANPYPWKFYRYEATFDAGGNVAAGAAYDQQDEIADYFGSANAGKGYPKTWAKTNWPSETYEWETSGRLKKRTYLGFVTEYTWNTGTHLLQKMKALDGQETWYDYDKLSRLSKAWTRPSIVGSKTSANVTAEYTYQYKNASNPNNYVKVKNTFTPVGGSAVNIQETFSYADGLGRLLQTVGKQQSPALKDVVTAIEYDNQGRQSKAYNPFETTGTSGAFVTTIPSGTPFTLNQYESSPLNRVTGITPPSWYATTTAYGANVTSEVKLDHAAGTYYAANSLLKTTVTEPGTDGAGTGNKVITYKDKKGRTIQVKRTNNAGSQTAETYNLYDDKDRLKLVIPPGAAYNSTGLTFSYTYDGADNILTKKVPDAATVTMKYNTRDQLALEQDGNLLAQSKWRCIRYDDYGRPIKTGLFSGTVPNPIQPTLDPTDLYTENTYDGTLAIEKGKLKKARTRVFDAGNTWLETNYTYDTYGRVSGTSGNNYFLPSDLNAETTGSYYDFADHVIIDSRVSKQSASVTHTILQSHTFDHWGRLKSNTHQVNGGAPVTISDLNYDWKNQLIEKNLGKTASGSYLQSLDYTYNDQGWLQTINNAALGGTNVSLASCSAPNPGAASSTPDNNDLFYLDLKYDVLQSGLNGTAQKNGNISQVIWRTRGRERQSYSLTYDFLSRLLTSTYADINDAGTAGASNSFREDLSYDPRGNILTLNRWGLTPSGNCFASSQIDNLAYTYNSGANKLQKMTDNAPAATKQYGWHNVTGAVSTAQYAYDANGNMTNDPYKGMTVSYNFLNLPNQMSFSSGTKVIDVLYDATGRKLRKTVTDGGVLQYRQEYAGGIEYRYTTAVGLTLEAIYHAEGRVYNNSGALRYEYAIRDHLGNTRLTFTDKNANGVVDVTNTSANEILQENHYYPFGLDMSGPWMNDAVQDNQYKYNGKELNGDFGLNWMDYGARWYDAALGRWWRVDPLAEKYPNWSPYNFVANNPIRFIDPDGRLIVDPNGKKVSITYAKDGSLVFSKNATADIKRIATALAGTETGRKQLGKLTGSGIKVRLQISEETKTKKTAEGQTAYTYGETTQGNSNKDDNYGKYVDSDGNYAIKEATIVIYEGSISEGIKDGSGLKHEGLTLEEAIGAVAGHETVHATDKKEINADLQAEQKGKVRPRSQREAKPEEVENKIITESKNN